MQNRQNGQRQTGFIPTFFNETSNLFPTVPNISPALRYLSQPWMGPSTNLWPFVREYHILYHIGAISKPFFYIEYIYIYTHIIYIYVYISELSHMIIIEDKIPKSIQVPLVWLETQQLAIPMGLQALVPADSDQLGSDDLRHCALADL